MILPTKHLSQDRSLLNVGARVLRHLKQPKSVSALWEELPRFGKAEKSQGSELAYDDFVLTLDLLFLIGAIEMVKGQLTRKAT